MTRSANEVMVLATKAARGAGAPPAQAAQFGAAAVSHLCAGFDCGALKTALAALPEGPILEIPLAIIRIAETARAGQVAATLVTANEGLAHSYVAALPYHATLSDEGVMTLDLNRPAVRAVVHRIDLPADVYAEWSTLAARLLVPESEASRLSGAGAGLSDND